MTNPLRCGCGETKTELYSYQSKNEDTSFQTIKAICIGCQSETLISFPTTLFTISWGKTKSKPAVKTRKRKQ